MQDNVAIHRAKKYGTQPPVADGASFDAITILGVVSLITLATGAIGRSDSHALDNTTACSCHYWGGVYDSQSCAPEGWELAFQSLEVGSSPWGDRADWPR